MIVVGGVVPPQDYDALMKAGCEAIFPPGTVIARSGGETAQDPQQAARPRKRGGGVKSFLVRAAFAALCALSLCPAASIRPARSSPTAQPVLGPKLNLQLYALRKGLARDPEQRAFTWNGKLYAHSGGGMSDIHAFRVHPFEGGDYIIQALPTQAPAASPNTR